MFRMFGQRKGENKMSQTMILSTIFEVSAIILFIIGLLNEKAIIEFEDRLAQEKSRRAKKTQSSPLIQRRARLQTHRIKAVSLSYEKT